MFRLINSHLQASSLQVKSQDAMHTLGSQCIYISCADVQISITVFIMYLIHVYPQLFICGQKQIHCRICCVLFRKVNDGQSPENTVHCTSLTCVAVSFSVDLNN